MSDAFERTVDLVASHRKDVLSRALCRGGSIAGLFAEDSSAASASLRKDRARPIIHRQTKRRAGAGIHVFDGANSAYACTDELSRERLHFSAEEAAEAFRSSGRSRCVERRAFPLPEASLEVSADPPPDTLDDASDAEVSALLHRAADAALSLLPNLDALNVDLQGRSTRFVAASSDGRFVRSARSTLSLRVHLRDRDGLEVHAVGGGAGGLGLFLTERSEDVAREAAERLDALRGVDAGASISGEHAVVIAGGWGGVWLHEVVGHALESDVGAFGPERLGEHVSHSGLTVIDDSNLASGRGGAPVDDEGSTGQRTVLIENGVLRGLLTDRASALRLGIPETGNGRRQDYRHPPLPRMSNLTLAGGDAAPEDLLREAKLYVKMIGRGRVVPSEDAFSFDVIEGYVIEGGRIGPPVTGLRLHGRLSDMLRRLVGIANDFRLDPGRGTCEKNGQVVPVSVGMPTILVDRMTIAPQE